MPSVTVGDEWFAASTSKNQALDLLAKAGGGEAAKGLRMHVNFAALARFATETLDVLAKNPDAVPMSAEDMEEVRKLAAALDDFDKLSINVRRENGQLRSSVHFKTR
jgi:predicted DNA-binding transcriptional regulator YafY